ncbi:MAG: hypothetical protein WAX89_04565 [Alphaproteobacteria bacterium]
MAIESLPQIDGALNAAAGHGVFVAGGARVQSTAPKFADKIAAKFAKYTPLIHGTAKQVNAYRKAGKRWSAALIALRGGYFSVGALSVTGLNSSLLGAGMLTLDGVNASVALSADALRGAGYALHGLGYTTGSQKLFRAGMALENGRLNTLKAAAWYGSKVKYGVELLAKHTVDKMIAHEDGREMARIGLQTVTSMGVMKGVMAGAGVGVDMAKNYLQNEANPAEPVVTPKGLQKPLPPQQPQPAAVQPTVPAPKLLTPSATDGVPTVGDAANWLKSKFALTDVLGTENMAQAQDMLTAMKAKLPLKPTVADKGVMAELHAQEMAFMDKYNEMLAEANKRIDGLGVEEQKIAAHAYKQHNTWVAQKDYATINKHMESSAWYATWNKLNSLNSTHEQFYAEYEGAKHAIKFADEVAAMKAKLVKYGTDKQTVAEVKEAIGYAEKMLAAREADLHKQMEYRLDVAKPALQKSLQDVQAQKEALKNMQAQLNVLPKAGFKPASTEPPMPAWGKPTVIVTKPVTTVDVKPPVPEQDGLKNYEIANRTRCGGFSAVEVGSATRGVGGCVTPHTPELYNTLGDAQDRAAALKGLCAQVDVGKVADSNNFVVVKEGCKDR